MHLSKHRYLLSCPLDFRERSKQLIHKVRVGRPESSCFELSNSAFLLNIFHINERRFPATKQLPYRLVIISYSQDNRVQLLQRAVISKWCREY